MSPHRRTVTVRGWVIYPFTPSSFVCFFFLTWSQKLMRISSMKTLALIAAAIGILAAMPAHAGKTLDAIKARGQVICGVNVSLAGFSGADSTGKWSGLDVDVCRAIAAA